MGGDEAVLLAKSGDLSKGEYVSASSVSGDAGTSGLLGGSDDAGLPGGVPVSAWKNMRQMSAFTMVRHFITRNNLLTGIKNYGESSCLPKL